MRMVKAIAHLIEQVRAVCKPTIRKVAGLGKFASGIRDLASNKNHLRNFGR